MNQETVKIDKWDSFWAFCESGILLVMSAAALAGVAYSVLSGSIELFMVLIVGIVHLVAYSVLGLPLFLIYWPKPGSLVWRWYVALSLGFMLGVSPLFIMGLYSSYPFLLICGGYGVVSADAGIWINEKRRN